MYCQAIEMTAVHELLANLFRCRAAKPFIIKPFIIKPFIDMQRPIKQNPSSYVPPSANSKIKRLKKMASECGDQNFELVIDSFFDDQIRNSFVHSDYCITVEEYRWTEGGLASSICLDQVSEKITRCFAFYEALFQTWKSWLYFFKNHPKYIMLPQYEVFELLTNEKCLYGFAIHFSNGTRAYFERQKERVNSVNLFIEKDGSINFFVGDLSLLEPAWKINGTLWNGEHYEEEEANL